MVPESEHLRGWKAIADYLNKSTRTAQKWTETRGLPVHKLGGGVIAYKSELNDWISTRGKELATSPEQSDGSQQDSNADATAGQGLSEFTQVLVSPRNGKFWRIIACSGAILAGIALCLAHWNQASMRPKSWRVTGSTLFILGDANRELWHHTFSTQLTPNFYDGGGHPCVIADLDGDGNREVLFQYEPVNRAEEGPRLFCFNGNGTVRWEFGSTRTNINLISRQWPPPYYQNSFAVITPREGPTRIAINRNHYWSFPDQVAMLDHNGLLLSEFWHRGHLNHMAVADLDGDGQPEILLGGVNDAPEYDQATLVVFDHRSVSGASVSPTGQSYFPGLSAGTEKALVFFPKTRLSQRQEFNRVMNIVVGANRITVEVAEGIDERAPFVIYDLDFQLHVMQVLLSDQLKARCREMEENGGIPRGTTFTDLARLKREVRIVRR